MRNADSYHAARPVAEVLEGRTLLSFSPSLAGQHTFPTHTLMKVDAGALGQPITFDATVFAADAPVGPVDLYYRGKLFQEVRATLIASPSPRFQATEATYTIAPGAAEAQMFGAGPHSVRASFVGTEGLFTSSSATATFRVTRPRFVTQPSGVGIATVSAGSGPALQPGQTATVRYNGYLAATYRLVYSTESQTPDTSSFVVDANPEQVIPGLDAGVVGMQAGETRAIYVPYKLAHGPGSNSPPRANRVYLVTLVSIG